ncbi:MAG: chemotaxis protein CheW [Thermochromatium sp.]
MSLDTARQAFLTEVAELLQSMEEALLALETDPSDHESLNAVFRAMHTIKGTGGVFGYDAVVSFTHAVETLMERVRSGQVPLTRPLIATLLECRDHTARLVDAVVADSVSDASLDPELAETGAALLARLESVSDTQSGRDGAMSEGRGSGQDTDLETRESSKDKYLPVACDLWTIVLRFKRDAFRDGIDPLSFLRYLGSLGELVHVITQLDPEALRDDPGFDPESCYLEFGIGFRGEVDRATLMGVFEFADQDCEIRLLEPDTVQSKYFQMLASVPDDQIGWLGDLLVQIGALTRRELQNALEQQLKEAETESRRRRLGEILVEQGIVKPAVVEQAARIQEAAHARRQEETRFIRVDAQRLGHLIDLIGELVTSSAAIRVLVKRAGIEGMSEVVDGIDYLVSEIRDHALQLRMVPIGESLSRFRRVVRDASRELGKEIELVITGGETELDKTVVEKLIDPLTHLIRNAVDHGIETPEVRRARGKPAQGTVCINAYHDSGHIVVEIADDGAGLDAERIRAKAEALGLVTPEDVLTQEEVLRLIFAPGLSTKEQATNLSGRGVGMDVVRRNIEALRGTVEIDSQPGEGTKITVVLPLTLAIIDGFLVGAGGDQYVIPLAQVVECVEMDAGYSARHQGKRYINLRGEVLPFIRLTELFESTDPSRQTARRESLVVVRCGHHTLGLAVDTLFGELQAVIKPLGKIFEQLRGVAGATILGTGDIALILDVAELAAIAEGRCDSPARQRASVPEHV